MEEFEGVEREEGSIDSIYERGANLIGGSWLPEWWSSVLVGKFFGARNDVLYCEDRCDPEILARKKVSSKCRRVTTISIQEGL